MLPNVLRVSNRGFDYPGVAAETIRADVRVNPSPDIDCCCNPGSFLNIVSSQNSYGNKVGQPDCLPPARIKQLLQIVLRK